MTHNAFHLIDKNTGEEIYASPDFRFLDVPVVNHQINDEALRERYGGPAVVDRVEYAQPKGDVVDINVYLDGLSEQLNDDNVDPDQGYRRS